MLKTNLSFWGGVEGVTGSNFLLQLEGAGRVLVDCGLFQGYQTYEKNRASFGYDPKTIDCLIVTHAHIDHIGRIPKLVKDGFAGRIFSTRQTKEIVAIMFDDALKIMAEDVKKRGRPALYDQTDIQKALSLWESRPYREPFKILPNVECAFLEAGHILGSAMAKISRQGRTIVITGDVGNSPSPIVRDAEPITGSNYLVLDSTYGDREHESRADAEKKFREVVARTIKERGTLLVPVFSLERAHIILFELNNLVESGAISAVPVYLDSPLASKLMPVYESSRELFNKEAQDRFARGDDIFSFPKLKVIKNNFESDSIEKASNPKIIIAGSGMSVGGRIPAHEIKLLPDPNTTLLITGYQSVGTLGRSLADGAKNVVINEEPVEVQARVESIGGFSAHRDSSSLLEFVETADSSLETVFVVHGEPKSSLFLAQRIKDYLNVKAIMPEKGRVYVLNL